MSLSVIESQVQSYLEIMMSTFDRNKLKAVLLPIVKEAYESQDSSADLRRNTLDVFSASLESALKGITFEEWLEQEEKRQIQKTLQNHVGDLHQQILATLDEVEDLGTGQILDLKSVEKKFVAEIKNKHNTTKGNHKIAIYDDILNKLETMPEDSVGYYVEILPKNGKSYDKPFVPSDNKTKERRPVNERIRQIDGQSFYTKVTGNSNALRELYLLLPHIVVEILNDEYGVELLATDFINEDEFDIVYGKRSS